MQNRRAVTLRNTVIGLLAVTALAAAASAQTSTRARSGLPRTPWGEPDLQGIWNNSTATPLERPNDLAGKATFTDEELVAREKQVAESISTDRAPRAGDTG